MGVGGGETLGGGGGFVVVSFSSLPLEFEFDLMLVTLVTSIPFLANLSQLPLERTLRSFTPEGLSIAAHISNDTKGFFSMP